MNLLIISDIHGDYETLSNVIKHETYDKIVILGDLFSYGYNKEKDNKVIDVLSTIKSNLVLIKGNCDVVDMCKNLTRPLEVITIPINKHLVTFTHGDKYKKVFLPSYHGDIFFSGHTHVPNIIKENGIIYANPGSLGKPRGSSPKSYIIFSQGKITIKDINGTKIKSMVI